MVWPTLGSRTAKEQEQEQDIAKPGNNRKSVSDLPSGGVCCGLSRRVARSAETQCREQRNSADERRCIQPAAAAAAAPQPPRILFP